MQLMGQGGNLSNLTPGGLIGPPNPFAGPPNPFQGQPPVYGPYGPPPPAYGPFGVPGVPSAPPSSPSGPGSTPGAYGTNAGLGPATPASPVNVTKPTTKTPTVASPQTSGKVENTPATPQEQPTPVTEGAGNPDAGLDMWAVGGSVLGMLSEIAGPVLGDIFGPSQGARLEAKNVSSGPATKMGDLTRIEERYTPYAFGEQVRSMEQLDNVDPRAQTLQAIGGLTDARTNAISAALNTVAGGQGGDAGVPMADAIRGASMAMQAGGGYDQAIAGKQGELTQLESSIAKERANMADQMGSRSGEVLYLQGIEDLGTETEQEVQDGGPGWLDLLTGVGTSILDVMTGGVAGGVASKLLGGLFRSTDVEQTTGGSPNRQRRDPVVGPPRPAGRTGG